MNYKDNQFCRLFCVGYLKEIKNLAKIEKPHY